MSKQPTTWEECGRDDLNMIPAMIAAGFTPVFPQRDKTFGRTTIENPPHNTVSFQKDDLHAWKCYTSGFNRGTAFSYWMTAKDIDGKYCDHKDYNTLTDLLNELK